LYNHNIRTDLETKMKFIFSKRTGFLAGFIALIILVGGFLLEQKPKDFTQEPLQQEDLVKLVKPSIVRILHRVTGSYTLPQIEINLQTGDISVSKNQKTETVEVDEYISGSGFVVSPDGYILTNSHVISQETIRYYAIGEKIADEVDYQTRFLTNDELKKIFKDEESVQELMGRAYAAVEEASSFDLNGEVVVLNPSSDKEDVEDLFKNGFPVEIIEVNDEFFQDEKDVALVKINHANLPSVPLAREGSVTTGNKIYVFGFPATAEFNNKNPLESTFTQGAVSATKFAESKEFKVYQTDAKISQGSSGGPMFNDRGEAIGIITFQTGELSRRAGDNFAFAIPISLAESVLNKHSISPSTGTFRGFFMQGLASYYKGKCEEAITAFSEAKKANFYFAPERYVDFYINVCRDKIAAGASLDTSWKQTVHKIEQVSRFAWFVVIGRLVLVLAALFAVWKLIQRLRKDEKEISELEIELEKQQEQEDMVSHNQLPIPEEGLHLLNHSPTELHPHLQQYITEARAIGMTNEQITQDLRMAGWNEQEIDKALKH
jgi:S1-C subfamily serine protease